MTRKELEKCVSICIYSKQFYVSYPYMVYDFNTGWSKLCHDFNEAKSCRNEYISLGKVD